jgi:antitoxin YefM
MDSISVNRFRENLKHFVEQVISQHQPLKVTRRNGENFVVISAEDWEREQETLYILQNQSLMQQIADSSQTNLQKGGYSPNNEELDEIFGV